MAFAMGYYHWFWFAQPHPFPEVLIDAAPETWFRAHTSRGGRSPDFFHADALADYLACARNPEMIRGMCEDYRAAASIDLEHDRASRADGREDPVPAAGAVGLEGRDRPLVRSAGDLAAILCGRGQRQRRQQRPLSRRGNAGGSARALPRVLRLSVSRSRGPLSRRRSGATTSRPCAADRPQALLQPARTQRLQARRRAQARRELARRARRFRQRRTKPSRAPSNADASVPRPRQPVSCAGSGAALATARAAVRAACRVGVEISIWRVAG